MEPDTVDTRIDALERRVVALTQQLEAIRGSGTRSSAAALDEPTSRRHALRLAGAAAVGTVAAAVGGVGSVAAADDEAMFAGDVHNASRVTGLTYGTTSGTVNGAALNGRYLLEVDSTDAPVGTAGALLGRSATSVAVSGIAANSTGGSFTGNNGLSAVGSAYGVVSTLLPGGKAQLLLTEGVRNPPPLRGDSHTAGEVDYNNGDLWLCVLSGIPGTWRKIAGLSTAGAYHPLTPGRVYDSREPLPAPGQLVSGANRTISVATRRAVTGGDAVQSNFVPSGAIAVAANIVAVAAAGPGFFTVNPGGVTAVNAATINWTTAGQVLANGVILTLGEDRALTIVCGGAGAAHVVVDIYGYYL